MSDKLEILTNTEHENTVSIRFKFQNNSAYPVDELVERFFQQMENHGFVRDFKATIKSTSTVWLNQSRDYYL